MVLQNHPVKSEYSKLRLLCRSLAGNNVYYLTVTAPSPIDEPKVHIIEPLFLIRVFQNSRYKLGVLFLRSTSNIFTITALVKE